MRPDLPNATQHQGDAPPVSLPGSQVQSPSHHWSVCSAATMLHRGQADTAPLKPGTGRALLRQKLLLSHPVTPTLARCQSPVRQPHSHLLCSGALLTCTVCQASSPLRSEASASLYNPPLLRSQSGDHLQASPPEEAQERNESQPVLPFSVFAACRLLDTIPSSKVGSRARSATRLLCSCWVAGIALITLPESQSWPLSCRPSAQACHASIYQPFALSVSHAETFFEPRGQTRADQL